MSTKNKTIKVTVSENQLNAWSGKIISYSKLVVSKNVKKRPLSLQEMPPTNLKVLKRFCSPSYNRVKMTQRLIKLIACSKKIIRSTKLRVVTIKF